MTFANTFQVSGQMQRALASSSSTRRALPTQRGSSRPFATVDRAPIRRPSVLRAAASGPAPSSGGGAGAGAGAGSNGGNGGKKKPGAGAGGAPHPMRPWTVLYATLLAGGGIMGYVKASSYKSLGMGLSASLILAVCALQMGGGPATRSAAIVASVIAAALAVVMGLRYSKTQKFMPAGLAASASGAILLGFLVQGY